AGHVGRCAGAEQGTRHRHHRRGELPPLHAVSAGLPVLLHRRVHRRQPRHLPQTRRGPLTPRFRRVPVTPALRSPDQAARSRPLPALVDWPFLSAGVRSFMTGCLVTGAFRAGFASLVAGAFLVAGASLVAGPVPGSCAPTPISRSGVVPVSATGSGVGSAGVSGVSGSVWVAGPVPVVGAVAVSRSVTSRSLGAVVRSALPEGDSPCSSGSDSATGTRSAASGAGLTARIGSAPTEAAR